MFVSGCGGTGKSLLIKTIRAWVQVTTDIYILRFKVTKRVRYFLLPLRNKDSCCWLYKNTAEEGITTWDCGNS